MAWNVVEKEPVKMEPKVYFTPAKEIRIKHGIKVGIAGEPETGKSYFAMTFPEPVYIIDTEFAAAKLAQQHFPDKDIRIFEAKVIDPATDQPDPIKSLDEVEKAIISLKDVNEGTIVVDTVTDYWRWIGAFVEKRATRHTKSGQPFRFEWATGNERYRYFIYRLLSKPVHVVLTSHMRPIYTASGEETKAKEPRWMGGTPHWCDVVILTKKEFVGGMWKYWGTISKCRFMRAYSETIEDITFDKLVKVLKDKLGVKIVFKR